jgi:16S rRNA (adenine1518-N6/adenine1519-N6)-dimethyltransferase
MRQKWGQNFLVNKNIAAGIVERLSLAPEDRLIEIGPGRGILTREAAGRVAEMTLVEIDKRWAESMQREWAGHPHVKVICADFLEWTPPPRPDSGPFKVMSNLPYSSGAAILQKLLSWGDWSIAVVMLQKEVAQRIVAKPGGADYGVLTLSVQSRAKVRALFDVSRHNFKPVPEVTSTVLLLEKRPQPMYSDEASFFRVVKAAFSQRRKTILNALSHGLLIGKDKAEAALLQAKIPPQERAENVALEYYDALSQIIS